MPEAFRIVIADNGYVIMKENGDGDTMGAVQIASDGELEVQLKAFRVAHKLLDSQKPLSYTTGEAQNISKMKDELTKYAYNQMGKHVP